MKTRLIQSLPSVLLLCLGLLAPLAPAQERPLRLALEHWPPYVDRYEQGHGLATRIVTTALRRAGYELNLSFDYWSRALEGTGIGVFDVIVTGWYTDTRAQQFAYSEPYLQNRIRFIRRADKEYSYASLDDLRGLLIGVVSDYAYAPKFDDSRDLIKIPANHVIQNLSLVLQGRLDLTLDDENVLRHQLRSYMPNSIERFTLLDTPLATRGLHMLVRRSHPRHQAIIDAFNREIRAMREDGSLAAILDQYQAVHPTADAGGMPAD